MDLFHLGSEFIRDLKPKEWIQETDPVFIEPKTAKKAEILFTSTCTVCSTRQHPLLFDTVEQQRAHFKSDLHSYNVKQKVKGRNIVSEEEFDSLLDQDAELSSLDGSDDSDDEVSTREGSPYFEFDTASGPVAIYKQIFFNKKQAQHSSLLTVWPQCQQRLEAMQQGPIVWILLMLGSGHFAGAVFDCHQDKVVAHKTFHRYTTRRKQGGAQSANDGKGRFAKSAGAGLRRYNEQALQEEVQALLSSWKQWFKTCDLVFVRANGSTNHKTIFFDDQVLGASDSRIRTFPFSTKRPTFSELERCRKELSTVRALQPPPQKQTSISRQASLDSLNEKVEEMDLGIAKKPKRPKRREKVIPSTEEPEAIVIPEPTQDLKRLMDLCQRGKVEIFRQLVEEQLEQSPEYVDTLLDRLSDENGTSLLHLAATHSQSQLVTFLLELGADPTMRALTGGNTRPYDVVTDKETREAFRTFRGAEPEMWDYDEAGIPPPLSVEDQEKQKERLKAKRKKQREKQKAKNAGKEPEEEEQVGQESIPEPTAPTVKKSFVKLSKTEQQAIGMTPEARARLDREKRALAAEARIRTQQNKCAACGKSLAGMTPFEKLQFKYCTMNCVKANQVIH